MHSATVIVAQWLIVIPILLWLYTLWASKPAQRWSLLFITIIGGIATVILAKIGASLVHDPRPFVSDGVTPYFKSASDNGFPSDHTLLATFLSLAIMSSKRWLGATLLGLAAMIGYARVLANVHHGIDILGAMAIATLGYLIALGANKIRLHYWPPKGEHPHPKQQTNSQKA